MERHELGAFSDVGDWAVLFVSFIAQGLYALGSCEKLRNKYLSTLSGLIFRPAQEQLEKF